MPRERFAGLFFSMDALYFDSLKIASSHVCSTYSKTCVKRPLSKRPKFGFQNQLSLNAGQSIAEFFNSAQRGAFYNTFDLQ